jgi:hypothetical protein
VITVSAAGGNPPGGGGGSGGTGGCTYNWSCTAWYPTLCSEEGIQTRTCVNTGTCAGTSGKPDENQTCLYLPAEEDGEEEEIVEVEEEVVKKQGKWVKLDKKEVEEESEVFGIGAATAFMKSKIDSVYDFLKEKVKAAIEYPYTKYILIGLVVLIALIVGGIYLYKTGSIKVIKEKVVGKKAAKRSKK